VNVGNIDTIISFTEAINTNRGCILLIQAPTRTRERAENNLKPYQKYFKKKCKYYVKIKVPR